jgi:hypothetical protein
MQPGMRWVQIAPRDGGATITLVTWFDSTPGAHRHLADPDGNGLVLQATRARRPGR